MEAVKSLQNLITLALSFYPYQYGYLTKKSFSEILQFIREWLSLW